MTDTKPERPVAKDRWLVTYVVHDDDREYRATVSAWSMDYACNLVEIENENATILSCVNLDDDSARELCACGGNHYQHQHQKCATHYAHGMGGDHYCTRQKGHQGPCRDS